jgi:hypothetical protein
MLKLVTLLAAGERTASELEELNLLAVAVDLSAFGYIERREDRCRHGECAWQVVYSLV